MSEGSSSIGGISPKEKKQNQFHHGIVEDNPDNDQKYIRTRSGLEVVLNYKDGEEQITLSAKDGQMRLTLSATGINVVNELGDINIKARNLTMAGADIISKSTGDSTINSDDTLDISTGSSGAKLSASGNNELSGSEIKLQGSTGVTAEMKQIAKQDDNVIGVDLHDIKVPTNNEGAAHFDLDITGIIQYRNIEPFFYGRFLLFISNQQDLLMPIQIVLEEIHKSFFCMAYNLQN